MDFLFLTGDASYAALCFEEDGEGNCISEVADDGDGKPVVQ